MASTQKLWQQNNNRLYWLKREQKQRELYMKEEEQQQKELEKIYADMYRRAEQEINAFYGKYADAEGIDITEAKKRVSQLDIEEYERLAKQYVADKDFSARANAEMRLYNATMRINRLEMLKARIGLHLIDGINTIDDYYEKEITDRTKEEIERQAGILGQTITNADTVKRAKEIVNASFFNATYSDRIWSHMDNLRSEISIQLQRGLIAGVGSREMARRIKEYAYDKSFADAHRLMVTELRRVQTDVAMSAYKDQGVERYVYLAVNPNACPICRALNGKDYPVEGAEIANEEHPLPPMHPRCHCTTAPYVDEDDYNSWLEWLNKGGTTSDWNTMTDAEKRNWLNRNQMPTQTPQTRGNNIEFSDTLPTPQKDVINRLNDEYDNHTTRVVSGAHKSAGEASLDGTIRLSSKNLYTAIHEFAHEIASEYRTKVGLGFEQDKDFWKAVKKVHRRYLRETEGDPSMWISTYEHSSRDVSEFMAEAFAQQKLLEYEMPLAEKYGKDTTYSRKVLDLINKYYRRK